MTCVTYSDLLDMCTTWAKSHLFSHEFHWNYRTVYCTYWCVHTHTGTGAGSLTLVSQHGNFTPEVVQKLRDGQTFSCPFCAPGLACDFVKTSFLTNLLTIIRLGLISVTSPVQVQSLLVILDRDTVWLYIRNPGGGSVGCKCHLAMAPQLPTHSRTFIDSYSMTRSLCSCLLPSVLFCFLWIWSPSSQPPVPTRFSLNLSRSCVERFLHNCKKTTIVSFMVMQLFLMFPWFPDYSEF